MKLDPLQRSVKAAYRASVQGQLETLINERSRWKRKATIAHNKLAGIEAEIQAFVFVLALEADKAGRKGLVLS